MSPTGDIAWVSFGDNLYQFKTAEPQSPLTTFKDLSAKRMNVSSDGTLVYAEELGSGLSSLRNGKGSTLELPRPAKLPNAPDSFLDDYDVNAFALAPDGQVSVIGT
jgi:hypothetical protein